MTEVRGTVFFMDGTKLTLSWPRQGRSDAATNVSNVKAALEADQIVAEVDGSLLVIPFRNIKYVQVTPAPEKLPAGVLRGARFA